MDTRRRHRRRSSVWLASATTAAVAAGGLAFAVTSQTASAAPTVSAVSPFDVTGGASVPFTEYEAEAAATNGSTIGPDYTQGTVASEASGRRAVTLSGQGKYVEFTLTKAANAVDVAYSLPRGASGTVSVYVNGTKIGQKLQVTAQYSYVDTGWIAGAKTHHFFDDSRIQLGQNLAAGAKVKLQLDSGDTGSATIDLADFEQVAPAAGQPANSVSVVSSGADASGNNDSTGAFSQAISTARSQGKEVWIPPGTFKVGNKIPADNVTIRGAGNWYSVVRSSHFIDQTSASGNTKLYDFAVFGDVSVRNDNSPDNFITGSLGPNSVVSGIWVQREKVGLWLTGNNNNLTVQNNRILGTTADGLNLDGSASGVTVKNNFLRNQGDDSLAMWSLNSPDTGNTFTGNTIVQPNLANGIAIYGGTNNTVSNNVVADTNALGSGIAISNQAFLQPFFPLSGSVTVSGNTLIRTGAINPNWGHPMGALRVDSYDSAITSVNVQLTNTRFIDSPYSAFEFVSGGGRGYAVSGVTVNGATLSNTATVVVQAETTGSASFTNVTSTGTGVTGVYNCASPPFAVNRGSGNSGWDGTWGNCGAWPPPNPGAGGSTSGGSTGGNPPTSNPPGGRTGQITGIGGKCVDVAAAATANGTAIQLYDCNGTTAQSWTVNSNGSLRSLGKCLDVTAGGTANGTTTQLYDCNGTGSQVWQANSNGTLVNPQSGKCLDATGISSANGTRLQIWSCGGGSNQIWHLPA